MDQITETQSGQNEEYLNAVDMCVWGEVKITIFGFRKSGNGGK